eukprot:scaffold4280_cov385-Prasinococcus_capsulatus_cf.AAC.10
MGSSKTHGQKRSRHRKSKAPPALAQRGAIPHPCVHPPHSRGSQLWIRSTPTMPERLAFADHQVQALTPIY